MDFFFIVLDIYGCLNKFYKNIMSIENLDGRSQIVETRQKRVNVDVLKQRLYEQQRKDRIKTTVTVSVICASIGAIAVIVS